MVFYFQTLIAPSLLLDIKSLWFNLTEANERIESRWQPAESVAAAARFAFAVNLVVSGRLLVSCLTQKKPQFQNETFKGKVKKCLASQSKISSSSGGIFTVKFQLGSPMNDRIHQFYIEYQNPDNLCKLMLIGQF